MTVKDVALVLGTCLLTILLLSTGIGIGFYLGINYRQVEQSHQQTIPDCQKLFYQSSADQAKTKPETKATPEPKVKSTADKTKIKKCSACSERPQNVVYGRPGARKIVGYPQNVTFGRSPS